MNESTQRSTTTQANELRGFINKTLANTRDIKFTTQEARGARFAYTPLVRRSGAHHHAQREQEMSNTVSKDELDAKLSLLEEKMDRRVERIETSISSFMQKIEENEKNASERAKEISNSIKSQRYWNMGIAVTVIFSLAALFQWSSTTAIDVSKIISGYNTEKINEVKSKQDDIDKKLNEIIESKNQEKRDNPREAPPEKNNN